MRHPRWAAFIAIALLVTGFVGRTFTAEAAVAAKPGQVEEARKRVNADTSTEALKIARQVLHAIDASDHANQAFIATTKRLAAMIEEVNPGKAKEIDELLDDLLAPVWHREGAEMLDVTAQTYVDNFTADELKQILAFYRSDVGKEVVERQPTITADEQRQILAFFRSDVGKKLVERQPAIMQKQGQIGQARGFAVYAGIREKLLRALQEKGLQTPPNM